MKRLVFLVLFVLFFQTTQAQSFMIGERSDTSVVILSATEKTDTVYKPGGVMEIINTQTIIPIGTVTFPKNLDLYIAYRFFCDYKRGTKSDSSKISGWDSLSYNANRAYLVKTHKNFSRYAYFNEKKLSVFTKDFYSEKTSFAGGMLLFYISFTLSLFLGRFYARAHVMAVEGNSNAIFWRRAVCILLPTLLLFLLLGITMKVDETSFIGSVVYLILLFFLSFDEEDKEFKGFTFMLCLLLASVIGILVKTSIAFFVVCGVMIVVRILGNVVPIPKFLLK